MIEQLVRFVALTVDEPPVRADGRCAICLQPRETQRSAKYAKGCAEIDPFCSTECAREFHENPIPAAAGGHLGYPMGRYVNA